jgi:hypothetical protein
MWVAMSALCVIVQAIAIHKDLDIYRAVHNPLARQVARHDMGAMQIEARGRLLRAWGIFTMQVLFLIPGLVGMYTINRTAVSWRAWIFIGCLIAGEMLCALVGLSDLRDGQRIAALRRRRPVSLAVMEPE